MNQTAAQSKIDSIKWVSIALIIYNALYWSGKFFNAFLPSFFSSLYLEFREHWGLMVLLELLAVASLFVDTIVSYDRFIGKAKLFRMLLMVFLTGAFIARIIIGLIDIYVGGGLR